MYVNQETNFLYYIIILLLNVFYCSFLLTASWIIVKNQLNHHSLNDFLLIKSVIVFFENLLNNYAN